MNKSLWIAAFGAVMVSGCATKEYVHDYVQARLGTVQGDVKDMDQRLNQNVESVGSLAKAQTAVQATLEEHAARLTRNEGEIARLSDNTREALERATAAGRLAEGKLLYEVVLKNDSLRFGSDSANLGKQARAALDEFAAKLKRDDDKVFIEIQGHTDSRGEAATNLRLGEMRAEAVRRYLNIEAGIPLHRMSVISYGEARPIASNVNRQGRAQNRRVVLVVLR
ncbi:MAG TPA: OmpA family protein [Thiobacillaceae bacterium]|nr:OmpA family protein [Thiobacillaceae bacterium]HNU65216.1 OmpA family protein [Thiobacillaceae bacterium]